LKIDFNFDVRTDANGKDPDIYSNTLKKYHQFLWSKELPNGQFLDLEEIPPYLAFMFNMQTINFSSDSIANSYGNTKRINHLINEIDRSEIEEFIDKNATNLPPPYKFEFIPYCSEVQTKHFEHTPNSIEIINNVKTFISNQFCTEIPEVELDHHDIKTYAEIQEILNSAWEGKLSEEERKSVIYFFYF